MPSNYIFYTAYRQYYYSANFITNYLKALYKICNSYRVNPFYSLFTYYLSNSIYREKKGIVLITTFSGPSAAYKLNYSRYYFCRRFSPYTAYINLAVTTYINLAVTLYINPAATTYINPATIYYGPPYYGVARS